MPSEYVVPWEYGRRARPTPGTREGDDGTYCVHETNDAETVREHARRGGFPCDLLAEVVAEFGLETARRLAA